MDSYSYLRLRLNASFIPDTYSFNLGPYRIAQKIASKY